MLPELQAWETHSPEGVPQLLIISTGSVEAHQAMGLRAPIVLDHTFLGGQAFGVTGTPMAVLLDAEGNIASDVVAGGSAVMALANRHSRGTVCAPSHAAHGMRGVVQNSPLPSRDPDH